MSGAAEPSGQMSAAKRALLALERMQARIDALEAARNEPVAVVGLGCRFPGADDPQSFWRLLRDGVDAVSEVPPDRWDAEGFYDPDPSVPGKMNTRWGGFLDAVDRFDPQPFRISPREARTIDPQHRLLLEVSWEALESAGLAPDSLAGSLTGVFVGITTTDYLQLQMKWNDPTRIEAYSGTGNPLNFAAGRVAYTLGLQGPTMAVDTACSSSLVAVHLACQSLRDGGCDTALAGGVNVMLVPEATLALSKARMMAPDGRCKTFDAAADGFVRGEGCGVVVLKRLSDALAARDQVLAVIRGSAVNQDGPSSGLTVPNGAAQQTLVRAALKRAGVEPARVGFVEAHGTGTSLGDPIEVRALSAVFAEGRGADNPLVVGSVKTNIGHLESAAGVAGLIKTVLALRHGEVPPNLHFKRLNPHISLDEVPIVIPTRPTPWPRGAASQTGPRAAGVSSFGASGTNAHVVLEEAPQVGAAADEKAAETERPLHLLTLSAQSETALKQLAARYAEHLAGRAAHELGDICYTANTGRARFAHRLAAVAETPEALARRLAAFVAGEEAPGLHAGVAPAHQRPKGDGLAAPRQGESDPAAFLESLGAAFARGAEVDWSAVEGGRERRRTWLPTYPFQRQRYWLDSHAAAPAASQTDNTTPTRKETNMQDASHANSAGQPAAHGDHARTESLLSELRPLIARFLETDVARIDTDTPFLEMGADSLVLIEAVQAIQKKYGVDLPIRLLFEEYTTLDALASYLAQKLPSETTAAAPPPPATTTAPQPPPTPNPQPLPTPTRQPLPAQPQPVTAFAPPPAPVAPGAPGGGEAHAAHAAYGPAPADASALERLMTQQLGTLSQLMAQQLELLRGGVAPAPAPAQPAANGTAAQTYASEPRASEPPPAPVSAANAEAPSASAKDDAESVKSSPWVPYQKLNPGRMEELTPRQQEYLKAFIGRYVERTPESKRQTQQYRRAHADIKPALSFRLCTKEIRYPIIGARSQGSRLWDVDGNEYVDFTMGYGLNLFGHNAPFIVEAIEEQLGLGMHVGPQTQLAGEVAELITELTGLERVAFCNTGTEAVMAAFRLARTATGRDKVVIFTGSYHGTWDGVLVNPQAADGTAGAPLPMVPGIPPEVVKETMVLHYGSARSLEILREHLDEVAAVVVEPVQSRKPELQPREFLQELRRMTEEAGVALIFDEVITGFRIAPGGAQEWFGVKADLATYGKIIGGGLAIGVVAGTSRFMDTIDGGVWGYGDQTVPGAKTTLYSGTFCKHPLAMAAARVVLRRIKSHAAEIYPRLNENTARIARDLNGYFEAEEVPLRLSHFGSLFRLGGPFQLASPDGMDLLFYHFIHKGVYVWEGRNWFLSTEHTDEDIRRMIEAVRESVAEMRGGGFLPEARPTRGTTSAGRDEQGNGSRPTGAGGGGDAAPTVHPTNGNGKGARPVAESSFAAALPLTDSQKHYWFLSRMSGEVSSAYNQSLAVRMKGALRAGALGEALDVLVARHEALRTTFSPSGDSQSVRDVRPLAMQTVDLSGAGEAEGAARAERWLEEESRRPFDLSEGPPVRASLLRLGAEHHLFVLTAHHIVIDGWSLGILAQELSSLYTAACEDAVCRLPAPVQFREYLRRQHEGPAAESSASEIYWLERMKGAPAPDLPTDHPRPRVQTYGGALQQSMLDADLCADLVKTSGKLGGTLFMTLLAAFNVLVRQLAEAEDVVVLVPTAGQAGAGAAHLVGECSNLLPMRTGPGGGETFAEFVAAVKKVMLDAHDHADYPFPRLVRKLSPPRDPSRWPLFNIDRAPSVPPFSGLEVELAQPPVSYTNFDFGLNVIQLGRQLQLGALYKTDLFEAATVSAWARHYETLLRAVVADPSARLSDLPAPPAEAGRRARREGGAAEVTDGDAGAAAYVAPRNSTEETLAAMWAEVLGLSGVGVEDDFFAAGGHSLLATQLISRVRERFNVELPLTPIFERPTVANLAECVERALRGGYGSALPPVRRVARAGRMPLSFAQRRLWFFEQLEPGNVAYNLVGAVRLSGRLDGSALARAFDEIIRRHESLRTTFAVEEDGTPVQLVGEPAPLKLTTLDLGHLPAGEREAEALRHGKRDAGTPFDLFAGPLVRASLLRLGEDDHVVVVSLHHIISDGWSIGVLFYEVAKLYAAFAQGRPSPFAELPVQYADYAAWQRETLRGEVIEKQLDYWRAQLAGAPALLELPTDRPRAAAPGFRGANEPFALTPELTRALRELSRREGVTLFMTLLAAFKALLHRYTKQEDIVVGTDVANRNRVETEGLIGFFVNLLALRTRLDGDPPFRELLARVKEVTVGAYANQDVPYDQIVKELRPERSLSRTPFVQALFVMQNTPTPAFELPGLSLRQLPLYTDTAEFELIVSVEETPEGLRGTFAYSTELFDEATVRRMQRHLGALLEQAAADPGRPLSAFTLMTDEELGGLSPADFPDAEVSRGDLENLLLSLRQD